MTPTAGVIPQPVLRRLTLTMTGWRWDGSRWHRGAEVLTEEAVDALNPQTWAACVRRWRAAASAMH
jgi:hypothetical protein